MTHDTHAIAGLFYAGVLQPQAWNAAMDAMRARLQAGGMLGLLPTEARLALLLASGKTVKDFVAIEGVSWHTARSHLKNILRKTGCHR